MNTRTLLAAGVATGPLFFAVAAAQATTRAGYDVSRHPLSLLSLGELGWVQITNFIVTGALVTAAAVGLARALPTGRGRVWGPRLLGAHGVGLVLAGVFTADPSMGFPLGAPAGELAVYSWHSTVHGVGFGLAMLSLIAACCVFARRFVAERRLGWALYSAATAVAMPAILVQGSVAFSVRAAAVTVIAFAWIGVLAAMLRRADDLAPTTAAGGSAPVAAAHL
jgi:hypothetical protein